MSPIIPNENGYFKKIKYAINENGMVMVIVDTNVIYSEPISTSKFSDILPILKIIATEWHLNISKYRDMKIAMRILKNSVAKN